MLTVECVKASGGDEFGRCQNTGSVVCSPSGTICKTEQDDPFGSCTGSANNCCRPNGPNQNVNSYCNNNPERCCRRDSVGIPRCTLNDVDCEAGAPDAGATCTTSSDCCGNPCVNGFCAAKCIEKGGTCTSNADCCPGLPCYIEPGASEGICGGEPPPDAGPDAEPPVDSGVDSGPPPPPPCALWGQTCSVSGDCCNGIPCTGGRCRTL